jgi:Proteasome regulatory subunit C-terminal
VCRWRGGREGRRAYVGSVCHAPRDGGIDAVLDHKQGVMLSKEVVDIYSTSEPQASLHARVAFCLDIHNEVGNTPLRLGLLPVLRAVLCNRTE